jgi:hypothetical protein
MKNTIIINKNNTKVKLWKSKWDREIGEVVRIDGTEWRVVNVHESENFLKMDFAFLTSKQLFNKYKF